MVHVYMHVYRTYLNVFKIISQSNTIMIFLATYKNDLTSYRYGFQVIKNEKVKKLRHTVTLTKKIQT